MKKLYLILMILSLFSCDVIDDLSTIEEVDTNKITTEIITEATDDVTIVIDKPIIDVTDDTVITDTTNDVVDLTDDVVIPVIDATEDIIPTIEKVSIYFNTGTTLSIDKNTQVTKPTNPIKQYYTFDNWYSDIDCTILFDFNTYIVDNTNIYAKFNIIKYDVNFINTTIDKVIVDANTFVTKPSNPIKEGYTFDNWYKEETLQTVFNFDTKKILSNTNIYAKFTINSYTVTFDSKLGSEVDAITVNYNETIEKPIDPIKEGVDSHPTKNVTFLGWFTDETFIIEYDFTTPITKDITLYAKWEYVELVVGEYYDAYDYINDVSYVLYTVYDNPNYLIDGWRYKQALVKNIITDLIPYEDNLPMTPFSELPEYYKTIPIVNMSNMFLIHNFYIPSLDEMNIILDVIETKVNFYSRATLDYVGKYSLISYTTSTRNEDNTYARIAFRIEKITASTYEKTITTVTENSTPEDLISFLVRVTPIRKF